MPWPPMLRQNQVTEDIREWDYGDYEGITSPDIRRQRVAQGLSADWDIWRMDVPAESASSPLLG